MLPNKFIIPLKEFNTFEADMLREADIKCFQVMTIFQETDQNYCEISWEKDIMQQNVLELMDLTYFTFEHFKQFLGAVSELQKTCEDYLLHSEKIDFSPENIYYNASLNRYTWRYYPVQNYKTYFKLSDLLTIILVRSNFLSDIKLIQNITSNPNEIANWLEDYLVYQKRENKSIWRRFQSKKNTFQEPYQQIRTTHKTTHPILMVKSNPQENYKLYFDNNLIGREDTCNIHICSPSISRQHALIFKIGQNFHIKDMGSTNGTFLNGKSIDTTVQIVNGDCIQIGEKELMFIR